MNDPIRIVHIITKLELGGAQVNTLYTVEHLSSEYFQTFLISGPGGMLQPSEGKHNEWRMVPHLARPIRPWNDFLALKEIVSLLRKWSPQIVHTHSSKAGILGRAAARICRVPVVIHTVHGFSFSPFQSAGKRFFFSLAERLLAPFTTHWIFVSLDDLHHAETRGLVKNNASLIRSGFPFTSVQNRHSSASLRRIYGIPDEAIVCGTIAPFKEQKGLFHLLAIARKVIDRHPQTIFFIAGDGELRPRLEKELTRLGLQDHFRLPGFIQPLEPILELFSIGISTALWEGLPQSLVQMRLKKIPLVASDIPGNREVVQEGKNGFLIDVTQHERFAHSILELIRRPDLRNQIGQFSTEDFSAWDADHMVKKQEELYLRLLSEVKKNENS